MNRLLLLRRIFKPGDQRGTALIASLLVIVLLVILSLAAMMSTGTELKLSANDRSAKQVFYMAESGTEDARSRLQVGASLSPINDTQPTSPNWTSFIGTAAMAAQAGYVNGNSNQTLYNQLNPSLGYVVTVKHKLDSHGNVLLWGDSNYDGVPEENTTIGQNIYVIKSQGYTSDGASKTVQIEASKVPSIPAPAALYTKDQTTIMGTSTFIMGMDHCGTSNVPGIITTATVNENGHPTITGSPSPIIQNSPLNIDVQGEVNYLKPSANYPYNVQSATLTGMNWGSPTSGATQQDATSCSSQNVVYFNTNSTYVKLAGGSQGCGVLLVQGSFDPGWLSMVWSYPGDRIN